MIEPSDPSLDFADGRRFTVVVGNLLDQPVECIVNAANGHLAHGGGVAAVIADAAGEDLVRDGFRLVEEQGEVATGDAVVTVAGNLPFSGVIHAVGPFLGQGDEEALLARAVCSALERAHERGWATVAMPAISSGIFGVPRSVCARAYCDGVERFFSAHPDTGVREVRLCLFDGPMVGTMGEEISRRSG